MRVHAVLPARPHRGALAAIISLVFVVMSMLAACGGGDEGTTTTVTSPAASSSTSPASTTSTTAPSGSTTIPFASTTSISATTTSTTEPLPGEPLDLGFPKAGDVLSVVGVAYNDRLNVRAAPGTDQPVLTRVGPLTDDLVASGAVRKLATSIWYEVRTGTVTGWVGSAFVAYEGDVDDLTSQVVNRLGRRPTAETMLDLGRIVAEALASDEPRSRIVVTVPPSVGDLGEVTYDVIGLGDDSVRGYRLHVFGQPVNDTDGFTLKSVEATYFCGRGVGPDGTCL